MRSLYWKIFLSFWVATILIIITTAWVTSEIAQKSSIPARERVFMDSYANAAVATFESGQQTALKKWLNQIGASRKMTLYLLSSAGEIIGNQTPPEVVKQISQHLVEELLDEGVLKFGDIIVSHEILSTSGKAYRLVAVSEKPLAHFVEIPWAGLTLRLIIAIVISGIICYLLSIYLTQPLRSLRMAAKSIATGQLNTRVGRFKGHHRDEIAELSDEFDQMAEQLENIINSKERLLQDISHELRSPLARLQIALELARKKAGSVAATEFSRMEVECMRLNTLIGEILEFARLDKSLTQLHRTWIDLPNLIKQIIDDANFELRTHAPGVYLKKFEPCQLYLDERLIHRALENIIRNALRYSQPNPEVAVTLYFNDSHSMVYVDIEDNGPGVPQEQLRKIFNPFYRVDSSREKKTGGYGLGLSIAERAITLHNGFICAENKPEGGLLVRIGLDLTANQMLKSN
ncbi:two-component system sensor histidine kinase CpxA [Legionella jordanis]|uniref:histidine kinase n=1 Tax=Legionella jordanis TaxID=456 RepID=A0A0W0VAD6_9GAMM|nr:ATP-binding protein [Legionella jordanis]KTD17086.1 sensor histidine kinase CpxA [Legionella jordanis]RMX03219.1 HAMP domain-containing protein [Legionella jordanis]RMX18641.1 HAMP domain-containing protein [Legionella jordanis]VEH12717.1 sensor histidine kinase CpxA [Legionella jordanis]HAT8713134.1 HAMP domain-containing protein [Legionella jordanis]